MRTGDRRRRGSAGEVTSQSPYRTALPQTPPPASRRTPALGRDRTMFRRVRLPFVTPAETAAVLARRGLIRPVRPDRMMRAGPAFRRRGVSPASAYVVNAVLGPERPAVIDDDRTVTYGQLDRRTNSLARALA